MPPSQKELCQLRLQFRDVLCHFEDKDLMKQAAEQGRSLAQSIPASQVPAAVRECVAGLASASPRGRRERLRLLGYLARCHGFPSLKLGCSTVMGVVVQQLPDTASVCGEELVALVGTLTKVAVAATLAAGHVPQMVDAPQPSWIFKNLLAPLLKAAAGSGNAQAQRAGCRCAAAVLEHCPAHFEVGATTARLFLDRFLKLLASGSLPPARTWESFLPLERCLQLLGFQALDPFAVETVVAHCLTGIDGTLWQARERAVSMLILLMKAASLSSAMELATVTNSAAAVTEAGSQPDAVVFGSRDSGDVLEGLVAAPVEEDCQVSAGAMNVVASMNTLKAQLGEVETALSAARYDKVQTVRAFAQKGLELIAQLRPAPQPSTSEMGEPWDWSGYTTPRAALLPNTGDLHVSLTSPVSVRLGSTQRGSMLHDGLRHDGLKHGSTLHDGMRHNSAQYDSHAMPSLFQASASTRPRRPRSVGRHRSHSPPPASTPRRSSAPASGTAPDAAHPHAPINVKNGLEIYLQMSAKGRVLGPAGTLVTDGGSVTGSRGYQEAMAVHHERTRAGTGAEPSSLGDSLRLSSVAANLGGPRVMPSTATSSMPGAAVTPAISSYTGGGVMPSIVTPSMSNAWAGVVFGEDDATLTSPVEYIPSRDVSAVDPIPACATSQGVAGDRPILASGVPPIASGPRYDGSHYHPPVARGSTITQPGKGRRSERRTKTPQRGWPRPRSVSAGGRMSHKGKGKSFGAVKAAEREAGAAIDGSRGGPGSSSATRGDVPPWRHRGSKPQPLPDMAELLPLEALLEANDARPMAAFANVEADGHASARGGRARADLARTPGAVPTGGRSTGRTDIQNREKPERSSGSGSGTVASKGSPCAGFPHGTHAVPHPTPSRHQRATSSGHHEGDGSDGHLAVLQGAASTTHPDGSRRTSLHDFWLRRGQGKSVRGKVSEDFGVELIYVCGDAADAHGGVHQGPDVRSPAESEGGTENQASSSQPLRAQQLERVAGGGGQRGGPEATTSRASMPTSSPNEEAVLAIRHSRSASQPLQELTAATRSLWGGGDPSHGPPGHSAPDGSHFVACSRESMPPKSVPISPPPAAPVAAIPQHPGLVIRGEGGRPADTDTGGVARTGKTGLCMRRPKPGLRTTVSGAGALREVQSGKGEKRRVGIIGRHRGSPGWLGRQGVGGQHEAGRGDDATVDSDVDADMDVDVDDDVRMYVVDESPHHKHGSSMSSGHAGGSSLAKTRPPLRDEASLESEGEGEGEGEGKEVLHGPTAPRRGKATAGSSARMHGAAGPQRGTRRAAGRLPEHLQSIVRGHMAMQDEKLRRMKARFARRQRELEAGYLAAVREVRQATAVAIADDLLAHEQGAAASLTRQQGAANQDRKQPNGVPSHAVAEGGSHATAGRDTGMAGAGTFKSSPTTAAATSAQAVAPNGPGNHAPASPSNGHDGFPLDDYLSTGTQADDGVTSPRLPVQVPAVASAVPMTAVVAASDISGGGDHPGLLQYVQARGQYDTSHADQPLDPLTDVPANERRKPASPLLGHRGVGAFPLKPAGAINAPPPSPVSQQGHVAPLLVNATSLPLLRMSVRASPPVGATSGGLMDTSGGVAATRVTKSEVADASHVFPLQVEASSLVTRDGSARTFAEHGQPRLSAEGAQPWAGMHPPAVHASASATSQAVASTSSHDVISNTSGQGTVAGGRPTGITSVESPTESKLSQMLAAVDRALQGSELRAAAARVAATSSADTASPSSFLSAMGAPAASPLHSPAGGASPSSPFHGATSAASPPFEASSAAALSLLSPSPSSSPFFAAAAAATTAAAGLAYSHEAEQSVVKAQLARLPEVTKEVASPRTAAQRIYAGMHAVKGTLAASTTKSGGETTSSPSTPLVMATRTVGSEVPVSSPALPAERAGLGSSFSSPVVTVASFLSRPACAGTTLGGLFRTPSSASGSSAGANGVAGSTPAAADAAAGTTHLEILSSGPALSAASGALTAGGAAGTAVVPALMEPSLVRAHSAAPRPSSFGPSFFKLPPPPVLPAPPELSLAIDASTPARSHPLLDVPALGHSAASSPASVSAGLPGGSQRPPPQGGSHQPQVQARHVPSHPSLMKEAYAILEERHQGGTSAIARYVPDDTGVARAVPVAAPSLSQAPARPFSSLAFLADSLAVEPLPAQEHPPGRDSVSRQFEPLSLSSSSLPARPAAPMPSWQSRLEQTVPAAATTSHPPVSLDERFNTLGRREPWQPLAGAPEPSSLPADGQRSFYAFSDWLRLAGDPEPAMQTSDGSRVERTGLSFTSHTLTGQGMGGAQGLPHPGDARPWAAQKPTSWSSTADGQGSQYSMSAEHTGEVGYSSRPAYYSASGSSGDALGNGTDIRSSADAPAKQPHHVGSQGAGFQNTAAHVWHSTGITGEPALMSKEDALRVEASSFSSIKELRDHLLGIEGAGSNHSSGSQFGKQAGQVMQAPPLSSDRFGVTSVDSRSPAEAAAAARAAALMAASLMGEPPRQSLPKFDISDSVVAGI